MSLWRLDKPFAARSYVRLFLRETALPDLPWHSKSVSPASAPRTSRTTASSIAEARSRRDGDPVETIGTYDPRAKGEQVKLKLDRVDYWLGKGAKPDRHPARDHQALPPRCRRRSGCSGRELISPPGNKGSGRQSLILRTTNGLAPLLSMLRIDVLTLFPRMLDGFLAESMLGRAIERGPPRGQGARPAGLDDSTSTARPMTGPLAAGPAWC